MVSEVQVAPRIGLLLEVALAKRWLSVPDTGGGSKLKERNSDGGVKKKSKKKQHI